MTEERDIPIFSNEETPSRYELLSMVRKHSNLSVQAADDVRESSDVEMDAQFWHEMLDLYFIRYRVSQGRPEDDLVFFVKNMNLHGYGFNDNMEGEPPFFVRRWAPQLEKVLGGDPANVDWRRAFYLNLVAHTSFTVTVAICSIQALHMYQSGEGTSLAPIYKVLSETDHCFCVLLNAHDGAAFPVEHDDSNSCRSQRTDSDSYREKISKVTLFSGFVNYWMVREAFDAGKSRFGSLLSMGHVSSKADRLYMRGPGGCGEVEVAVSGIADQSLQDFGPHSPIQLPKRGLGIDLGTIVHRAASAASVLAKNAYAAASSQKKSDREILPLKCCLMSISLPWESISHDLLFKATPPVNM